MTQEQVETKGEIEVVEEEQEDTQHMPQWKVLLHNDDHNSTFYVARTIQAIIGHNEADSFILMIEAHKHGVSLLTTTHKERAELYQEQFQSKGLTVTIEADE